MEIKKIASVLLAVMLAGTMFAACGNSGGSSTAADGTAPTTNGGGDVALRFMGWEASPLETAAVKNGIAKFEEQNPGVKVDYTPTGAGDDYNAKLLAAIAGDNCPDLFFAGSGDYRTLVSKKALLDITDRFSDQFPLEDFIESSRTIMTVDDKVYGISSCSVSPIIYYNKDIFDAANEPYPPANPANCWTIDEFREVAKRLTTDDIYGCYGLETVNDTLSAQLISGGGNKFTDDYMHSAMNTPEVKRVLEIIKAVRVEDGAAPSASTLENAGMNAKQMLQTGKVAMLMDGSWSLQELSTMDFPVGIAPLPSYGKVMTTGQAHLHVIAAQSKHPDEAWKFLQFLSSMDYQGQLCKEGLWLPNRYSLWEDGPDGIDGWYDEARLGPYYKEMKEYLRDAQMDPSAVQKASICGDIIREETDKFFKEDTPIETVLDNIVRRTDKELEAYRNS